MSCVRWRHDITIEYAWILTREQGLRDSEKFDEIKKMATEKFGFDPDFAIGDLQSNCVYDYEEEFEY